MKKTLYILILALIFISCNHKNTPGHNIVTLNEFTTSVANFYGAFYKTQGIENNVISLDLFSEGIKLNEQGYMEGTGTNLFFSDIFLSPTDTFLLQQTYEADTTAQPFTFLKGVDYEGNITGAYLLNLQENILQSFEIFPNGNFVLSYQQDSVFIDFSLQRTDQSVYHATFKGTIPYYDLSKQSHEDQQATKAHLKP